MRSSLLVVFALSAIACTGAGKGGGGGAGGSGGGGGGSGGGGGGGTTGAPAFEITSPNITVAPGQEVTYCYYFHTSNKQTVAVNKWVSVLAPGSHHMIMYLNPKGSQPADGTIDQSCGGSGGSANVPVWTYATQVENQEENLPGDDGTGKPLAQNIAAGAAGYFQMHYLNATPGSLSAHVELRAYALPVGTSYTETDAYVTYNNDIRIPPNATNFVVSATCPVPAAKFWTMSTHSHKQSVGTTVLDGSTAVFSSADWQHPGSQDWKAPSFFTFTAPMLTWTCTYNNTGSNAGSTVVAGPSAQTNEMCMATGYYFPATGPKFEFVSGGTCYSL